MYVLLKTKKDITRYLNTCEIEESM